MMRFAWIARLRGERGQSIVEMAMIMPLLTVVALGVVEVSWAVLDQHVVTKLTREGSNLISRDTSLLDASNALKSMATRPVNFDGNARMIFSVIKRGDLIGSANFDKDVLYARYAYGSLGASSKITTRGGGNFGPAPEFQAVNSDNDANLQLVNFPPNLLTRGGMLYVTEIYTRHTLLTPFDRLGIQVPDQLYSIAYF
jgi:hypothetical protein